MRERVVERDGKRSSEGGGGGGRERDSHYSLQLYFFFPPEGKPLHITIHITTIYVSKSTVLLKPVLGRFFS